ncbi:YlbD family protein [Neobacillus niacini]|uniref:YlbD family protein n=1 Tax=Neobacillus niacini TaxID=86668 RepID=UPI0021CB55A5|nr:YlbD family protein [Neobacillus niacini]MCM3768559.1 YlbD family protein [Neobacillus niacini]
MAQKKLHPSVLKFKEFVKSNPTIIQEVRKGNATWQELYEDWYLLGEDDKRWESIGTDKKDTAKNEKEGKGDFMSNVMGMFKNLDPNQMQTYLQNASEAVAAVQGLLAQFQGTNSQNNQVKPPEAPPHPFSFRQD